MNWNVALTKLLDISKEEENANTNISSKDNNGIRNTSVNNISVRIIHKLTIEKEVNQVITVENALLDVDGLIKEAEAEKDNTTVKLLKAIKVVIKFLSTIRSNQLLCEEDKVKIREAKAKRDQTKEVK